MGSEILTEPISLSDVMEEMAQPLTIVRSAVAGAAAAGVTEAAQRRYLELSCQQVERACGLFECLQGMVIAHQIGADQATFELCELLASVIEDERAVLLALSVELKVLVPCGPLFVFGDMARTVQAVFASLKATGAVSGAGDVVEVSVAGQQNRVELTIQNRRIHGRSLKSSERLGLTLAEANIRSQRGGFDFREDPFRVVLTLPFQDA
jgi:hypothetical protein